MHHQRAVGLVVKECLVGTPSQRENLQCLGFWQKR